MEREEEDEGEEREERREGGRKGRREVERERGFKNVLTSQNLSTSLFAATPKTSSRARTRWLVAYTLLRNPVLQELRVSQLGEEACGDVDNPFESSLSDRQ